MGDLPAPVPATPGEVVPCAEGGTLFADYRWRAGLAATGMVVTAGIGAGILTALAAGTFGFAAGFAALGAAIAGMSLTANIAAVFGNQTLRDRLRRRLDLTGEDVEFVGLLDGNRNTFKAKLLAPNLETDDNVGFLAFDEKTLRIHLEDTTLIVPRDELRKIEVERVIELPLLRWIRLEFYRGQTRVSFLLMSREGSTLSELHRATRTLHDRLITWYLAE